MWTTFDPELQAIVRALARYLRTHPLACDTADGIARWWFDGDVDVDLDKLMEALVWMTGKGVVERLPAADGHVRFRRRASDEQLDALHREGTGAPPLS